MSRTYTLHLMRRLLVVLAVFVGFVVWSIPSTPSAWAGRSSVCVPVRSHLDDDPEKNKAGYEKEVIAKEKKEKGSKEAKAGKVKKDDGDNDRNIQQVADF